MRNFPICKVPITKQVCAVFLWLMAPCSLVAGPNFRVIHAFGQPGDGQGPTASVVFDTIGNIYGTTVGAGAYNAGVVYELIPGAGGQWNEVILYAFGQSATDGSAPQGEVLVTKGGPVYGKASGGGSFGRGTLFELQNSAHGWIETILHEFDINDLSGRGANVVQDASGNLYSGAGGTAEFVPGASAWTDIPICLTGGCVGTTISSRISRTNRGTIYGASGGGGPYLVGTVYEVVPTGNGWQEHDLYDFGAFPQDGQIPSEGPLAVDEQGNLYGITGQGGDHECVDVGCGTVYKLTRNTGSNADGPWKETILYNFKRIPAMGIQPSGNLVRDKGGNLYGVMGAGGAACGCGTVYRLSPTQTGEWNYQVIHTFVGTDGILPNANLTFGADGNLYGTTLGGGPYGGGVVFEISRQ